MKVIINDQQYSVRFRHHQEGGETNKKLSKIVEEPTPLIRHTECKILLIREGKEPAFVCAAYSRCHPKDNFVKEKGRQFSLKSALAEGNFSKEDRAVFWSEYRTYGTIKDVVTSEEGEILVSRQRF